MSRPWSAGLQAGSSRTSAARPLLLGRVDTEHKFDLVEEIRIMHMARMAEKQKRIKNLREFLAEEVTLDPSLRTQLEGVLSNFQKFLSTVWNAKTFSAAHESELANYERQLEMLSEEIRMVVTPRVSRTH